MRTALLLTLASALLILLLRVLAVSVRLAEGVSLALEMLVTLLAFGAGGYLGLFVLDGDHRDILPVMQLERGQVLWLSVCGVLCAAPMTLLADTAEYLAALASGQALVRGEAQTMASGAQAALLLPTIVKSVIIVPVCEELFFRGYLLGALRRCGTGRAVLVSSLCFAFVHGVGAGRAGSGMLLLALFGALLCALVLKTGSIAASVLVHAGYNLTIILIACAGLSGLFDRLTIVSCVLRVAMCFMLAAALSRAFKARGSGERMTFLPGRRIRKREMALLIGAPVCVLAAAVFAGVIG